MLSLEDEKCRHPQLSYLSVLGCSPWPDPRGNLLPVLGGRTFSREPCRVVPTRVSRDQRPSDQKPGYSECLSRPKNWVSTRCRHRAGRLASGARTGESQVGSPLG